MRSGKASHWTDRTLQTLVERTTTILLGVNWFEGGIDNVYSHSELDPVTRPHDFAAFLSPDEFRQRVSDNLARERRAQRAVAPPAASAGTEASTPAAAAQGDDSPPSAALLSRVAALEAGLDATNKHVAERLQAIARAANDDEA